MVQEIFDIPSKFMLFSFTLFSLLFIMHKKEQRDKFANCPAALFCVAITYLCYSPDTKISVIQ